MCNFASYSHVNRCQVFNYTSCLFPMSLMGAASLTRELPHQPATHPPFQLSNNFAHFALWILLAYWSKVSRGFCTSNSVFQGKFLTDLWATHPTLNIAHSKVLNYLLLHSKCSVTWQTFGYNSSRLSAAPTLHILLIAHIPYILLYLEGSPTDLDYLLSQRYLCNSGFAWQLFAINLIAASLASQGIIG